MIDQEVLVRSVTEAAADVFSTMLDMKVRYIGLVSESRTAESGLISLVGITGEWGGSGIFCCTPALARIISARMLGNDPDPATPAIDEDVLDVVAEVTNMMIGNIKNGIEPITGPLAISVPTVIHGRNFQFRNVGSLRAAGLVFSADGERFEVRISLAPVSDQQGVRARIPVLGLAHI